MGRNTPSVEWGASFSTLRPQDRPDVLQNADVLAVREPLELLDGLEQETMRVREPIPHTWAPSNDNLFQSNLSAWSNCEAILGKTHDWPI